MSIKVVGRHSGRKFDPLKIGVPIRRLDSSRIRVTHRAVDVIEKHLNRFAQGLEKPERVMIERLRRIANGNLAAEPPDINFYAHELREFVRYKILGFATGVPANADEREEIWNNAHSATLEEFRIRENSRSLDENPLYQRTAAWYILNDETE